MSNKEAEKELSMNSDRIEFCSTDYYPTLWVPLDYYVNDEKHIETDAIEVQDAKDN